MSIHDKLYAAEIFHGHDKLEVSCIILHCPQNSLKLPILDGPN